MTTSSSDRKPAFHRFDHVQLAMPAGKEMQARAFYDNVLGMSELTKPAALARRGGCWFASGGINLHLGVDPDFRPAKKAHPALECSDLADLLTRFQEAGIAFRQEDSSHDGRRHVYVDDPFGNRIELIG